MIERLQPVGRWLMATNSASSRFVDADSTSGQSDSKLVSRYFAFGRGESHRVRKTATDDALAELLTSYHPARRIDSSVALVFFSGWGVFQRRWTQKYCSGARRTARSRADVKS